MKTKNKVHLQCGIEDDCKHKDCRKCKKVMRKYNLNLSFAEQIAIEDFAVCDLIETHKQNPKDLDLMQDIIRKTFGKMIKEEKKNERNKN